MPCPCGDEIRRMVLVERVCCELQMLAGWTNCIQSDIGLVVTGSVSAATGVLDCYDNVAGTWQVCTTSGMFVPNDICTLSGGGTGTGTVCWQLGMLLDGYTDCIPGDITKTVTGSVSFATGILDNYDNVARTWNVAKTAGTFLPTDICTLSGGGTGVGAVNTVSPALSEIDTQIADLQAKKIAWQTELIGL